ncbi:hypothetical protein JCM10450v2_003374 [Rhodotorula kratochvilovae]
MTTLRPLTFVSRRIGHLAQARLLQRVHVFEDNAHDIVHARCALRSQVKDIVVNGGVIASLDALASALPNLGFIRTTGAPTPKVPVAMEALTPLSYLYIGALVPSPGHKTPSAFFPSYLPPLASSLLSQLNTLQIQCDTFVVAPLDFLQDVAHAPLLLVKCMSGKPELFLPPPDRLPQHLEIYSLPLWDMHHEWRHRPYYELDTPHRKLVYALQWLARYAHNEFSSPTRLQSISLPTPIMPGREHYTAVLEARDELVAACEAKGVPIRWVSDSGEDGELHPRITQGFKAWWEGVRVAGEGGAAKGA